MSVDPEFVQAYAQAAREAFSLMLSLEAEPGPGFDRTVPETTHEVSAVVGLSGDLCGALVISFPGASARAFHARLLGASEPRADVDQPVVDAVGEIANIIAGSAKSALAEHGVEPNISLPTVIVGAYRVWSPRLVPFHVIPFHTAAGAFTVEVSVRRAA